MDVLFLGGTRYFGRGAAERLLKTGHNVIIYSRGNVRPGFWDDIEHIKGDRTDAAGMNKSLKNRQFDAVIDNQCFSRKEAVSAIDALRGRVGRYIVASTVSTYGEAGQSPSRVTAINHVADDQRWWTDHRAIAPVMESHSKVEKQSWGYREDVEEYAQGKRHMERVMLESPDDWPWTVVRVPATLGPDDPSGRFAWWLWRIMDGNAILLPDGGHHATQVGYVHDLSQFLVDAISAPAAVRNIYNFAQRETPALIDFLRVIANAANKTLNALPVPSEILHRKSGLPWHEYGFAPFSHDDSPVMSLWKAQRDIGPIFTPLTEWVGTTVDWYQSNPDALEQTRFKDQRVVEINFARRWQSAIAKISHQLS